MQHFQQRESAEASGQNMYESQLVNQNYFIRVQHEYNKAADWS